MPTTRSGSGTPAAISPIRSEEVLEASTASGPTTAATAPNSSRFSSSSSGAASISSSQPVRSPNSWVGRTRAWAASASASLQRPRAAPLASASPSRVAPFSAASGKVSNRRVSKPPSAASWAMPAPMVPAPRTPTRTTLTGP